MNQIIITGNLGSNPEIKATETTKYAHFSIAHNIRRKSADGKTLEITEWHKVTVFNEYWVDMVAKQLNKGTHVQVEGQLRNRKTTKEDGTSTILTEIVVCRHKGGIEILHQPGVKLTNYRKQKKYSQLKLVLKEAASM